MKNLFAFILVLSIFTCGRNTNENMSDSRLDRAGCATAIQFANAQMTERMVKPLFSGDLNNYFGADTTKLDFKHTFEKGKLITSKFYYENGRVQEEYNFRCQSLHGAIKYFHTNGQLGRLVPYRYGRKEGIGYLYDSLGLLKEKVIFKNDSLLGEADSMR